MTIQKTPRRVGLLAAFTIASTAAIGSIPASASEQNDSLTLPVQCRDGVAGDDGLAYFGYYDGLRASASPLQATDAGLEAQCQLHMQAMEHGEPAYSPGVVDGVFGANSQSALAAFQAHAGVTPDGWPGPETWPVLRAEVRG